MSAAKTGAGFLRGSKPYIGVYHTADMPEFFTNVDYIGMDALSMSPLLAGCHQTNVVAHPTVYFANYLDPNAPKKSVANVSPLANITWPSWNSSLDAPPLLTFLDCEPSVNITTDTYRLNETDLLTNLFLQSPRRVLLCFIQYLAGLFIHPRTLAASVPLLVPCHA